jgi:putative flippase GtrA
MRQLFQYAAVGVVATIAHYLTMVVCVEAAHWQAWMASGYGAIIGAQVAYLGNRWFTFSSGAGIGATWLRFQVLALAGAIVGMAIVALGVHLGAYYLWAQMAATLTVMLMTFAGNRAWTFRRC